MFVLTFSDGGKLLQINDVKQSDIANYSCIVSTQVDSVVSNMANLNIEEVNLRSKVFVEFCA